MAEMVEATKVNTGGFPSGPRPVIKYREASLPIAAAAEWITVLSDEEGNRLEGAKPGMKCESLRSSTETISPAATYGKHSDRTNIAVDLPTLGVDFVIR